MVYSDLPTLTCGNYEQNLNIKDIFNNLAKNITNIEELIIQLPEHDSKIITLVGPFYGRTLLESICTILIGRLDPFRLLYLKNIQQQSSFKIGDRSEAAINWNGDIFEKGISDKNKMWDPTKKYSTVGRGLLGDYYGEVYWQVAYQKLLDETVSVYESDILNKYRQEISADKFILAIRQRASTIYSSLSKGVHSELIINSELRYDKPTVFDLITDTIEICSILTLVSHYIDTCSCKLDCSKALEKFINIERMFLEYGK